MHCGDLESQATGCSVVKLYELTFDDRIVKHGILIGHCPLH